MRLVPFIRRHRAGTSAVAAVMVAALGFGLSWFQPWKLWTNTTVDEAIPAVAEAALTVQDLSVPFTPTSVRLSVTAHSTAVAPPPKTTPATSLPSTTAPPPSAVSPKPEAVQLLSGNLISHEHDTSGSVKVLELADGSRVLTLEDLVTSNGPDVHVWLAAAPVIAGGDGWYVFDDQAHVDLGELKGNLGNQVYEIPPGVDLDQLPNVSLWCERFAVSFGAAELG